jgi:eukaryotic-like serine/threonine-protein kinase
MPDSLPPNLRNIGRYALLRELRRDRVSVSYFAMDPVLHREVIIKAVQLPLPSDSTPGRDAQISPVEQAFVRQAQAAGKLHHPHIVTVFEAGRMRNIGYLAIERVPGRRLHELIAGGWRPEFVHAASIAARIADAIEYAHVQGVAHGNLGPAHVILQESDGAPKVEGFGGWVDGGDSGGDMLARTEGVLPYFDDIGDDVRRRDVRAIAALVYMMLTGRSPDMAGAFSSGSAPLRSLRLDTPAELATLIDDALAADARSGHRSAGDLRDALTAFIWNERTHNVAPATIGIPLAAPPSPARPATTPVSTVPPASLPRVVDVKGDEIEEAAPLTIRDAGARASRWLRGQRFPLVVAVSLLVIGIVIGVLIATLAQRPAADNLPVNVAVTDSRERAGVGVILLDIVPWGEVYVDNRPVGVAPPLKELQLPSGRHAIEIRYSTGKAVTANVDVDPARPSKIQHSFK